MGDSSGLPVNKKEVRRLSIQCICVYVVQLELDYRPQGSVSGCQQLKTVTISCISVWSLVNINLEVLLRGKRTHSSGPGVKAFEGVNFYRDQGKCQIDHRTRGGN